MKNLVSILVPTYNRKNLLNICLKSILNQSYQNLEIIVIDDASDSPVNEIINNLNDKRIKLITNTENIGSKKGDREHFRRFVQELMTGEYFIYITDDDYWPDEKFIENAVKIFENNKNISSVIGSQLSEFYDHESQLKTMTLKEIKSLISKDYSLDKYYYFKDLFKSGYYSGHEYLKKFSDNATSYNISITASLRRKSHCLDSKYLVAKEPSKWQGGYEYNIVPALKYDIYFINEPCVVARIHKNNASFRFTQYQHYMDSVRSIINSFENIKEINLSTKNLQALYKIKESFLKSLSVAYMFNTFSILKGNKLSLTSKENNERYVTVKDIFKVYFHNKVRFSYKEISLAVTYYIMKIFRNLN